MYEPKAGQKRQENDNWTSKREAGWPKGQVRRPSTSTAGLYVVSSTKVAARLLWRNHLFRVCVYKVDVENYH